MTSPTTYAMVEAALVAFGWYEVEAHRRQPCLHGAAVERMRAALAAAQAGAPEQLFVVHNPKASAVYVFDNHDAALRCRTELKLDHWHLWGQVVLSDWHNGQPIRALRSAAPAESEFMRPG